MFPERNVPVDNSVLKYVKRFNAYVFRKFVR